MLVVGLVPEPATRYSTSSSGGIEELVLCMPMMRQGWMQRWELHACHERSIRPRIIRSIPKRIQEMDHLTPSGKQPRPRRRGPESPAATE